MARRILSLVFLLFVTACGLAGASPKWLDSMENALKGKQGLEERLNCLYSLSFEYGLKEPRKGIAYGKQCLKEAIEAKQFYYQYNAYNGMANCYETLADFDSARWCNMQSYGIAKKMGKKKPMALALMNAAVSYKEQGDYQKALDMYLEGYRIFEKEKDYNPRVHFYISDMFMRIGDYRQAEYHARFGISQVRNFAHDTNIILNHNINLGKCLLHRGKTDSAIAILTYTSEELKKQTDQYASCLSLTALGEAYLEKKNYSKALSIFLEELALQKEMKNESGLCQSNLNVAYSSAIAGNGVSKTKEFLMQTEQRLSSIRKNKAVLLETYYKISQTYELIKEPVKALAYFKQFSALSDTLLNKEKFQQLNELQTRYETEKKEEKIMLQKAEIDQQASVLERKKLQLISVIAVFAFIIVMGLLFYFHYESKQKIRFILEVQRQEKLREAALEQKEREERDRISKDIHDELGSGLSKIALLAEYSKQQLGENNIVKENVSIISRTAKTLAENMRDLVWTLNPNNSTLDNLAARIHEYGSDYLEELSMKARFEFPDEVPPLKIPKEVQRNIFLTFKEAMNNSVKHAGANEFHIHFGLENNKLNLLLADNGKGFDKEKIRKTGNGLRNMEERIKQIGGHFELSSTAAGTSVNINLVLEAPKNEILL